MNKYDSTYIEGLKARWNNLNKIKIQTETELKSAQAELDKAIREANEEFGVNTLDELRDLYAKRVDENNRNIEQFETSLNTIETKLQEI